MSNLDIIIIGAGMTGASIAYEVSKYANVLLLEREEHPGYHSTGRSAAAFIPSYGRDNPALKALTDASLDFLLNPPDEFSPSTFLKRRGLLTLAREENSALLVNEYELLKSVAPNIQQLTDNQLQTFEIPLTSAYRRNALFEPDVYDIDVHGLHQSYLKGFVSNGGALLCNCEVISSEYSKNAWQVNVRTGTQNISHKAPIVVNASGAWGDKIAEISNIAALDLTPMRRTAILLAPPKSVDVSNWPLAMAAGEHYYFKPDAGKIMLSPADEHPCAPSDVQPEELDIAYAAHFAEKSLGLDHSSINHTWAGLRTFTPDRTPAIGYTADHPGFFWSVGQGGHGIQTAPAAAQLAAHLLLGNEQPSTLQKQDFQASWVTPERF